MEPPRLIEGPAAPLPKKEPIAYADEFDSSQPATTDSSALLLATLRRWKLIVLVTLLMLSATYGAAKLFVPSLYKSTVAILVYDPQRQFDATVQKPVSLFIDAIGEDAMSTEINVLRSKSVALRVAAELNLDKDPEFQPREFRIADWIERMRLADWAKRFGLTKYAERLGFPRYGLPLSKSAETTSDTPEDRAERLDQAADGLLKRLDIWQESYIIFVSASSRDPVKAQRLAATVAGSYLASQREAREESLDHLATWLKDRVDDLRSRVLETESSIAKLKAEGGGEEAALDRDKERQIGGLNVQLMTAREQVSDMRSRLDQARQVVDAKGRIDSVPELTASPMLAELRRKEMELNWSVAELHSKVGEGNSQVISIRAELATVGKQIHDEEELILDNMKNAYDNASRRLQSLETNFQALNTSRYSGTLAKLQELERIAESDRKVYDSYLTQYNDIAERRLLQTSSARVISPAAIPRSPSSSRLKLYAIGGVGGLGLGLLVAFLLEYLRGGVKTNTEIEQSFALTVIGNIPLIRRDRMRREPHGRPLDRMFKEPLSQLSEAVHTTRINLELSSANPKVVLITSALPREGKSTTAMLLAASSAIAGKKVILLDCDLRMRTVSEALGNKRRLGLSEILQGRAQFADVVVQDPLTKIYMLPAGSLGTNTPDALMSQQMLNLIAHLRTEFDYVVMDAPPLLPVADSLALATAADKILVIVEWGETSRASISEALRVLGPELSRVAGIVLNKVNFNQLPGYGSRYQYRASAKYFGAA